MSLSRIARLPSTAVSTAAWVATHPVQTTSRALGFAKGVVTAGVGLTEVLRTRVPDDTETPAAPAPTHTPTVDEPREPVAEPVVEHGYVAPPPNHAPPSEPPIDVVEQALAAEQEEPTYVGGPATEPHPVTREEIHGEATFVREEREEIDEETDEGLGRLEDDRFPA